MFNPSLVFNLVQNSPAIAIPKPRLFLRRGPKNARASLHQLQLGPGGHPPKSAVIESSLRLLEWDKVSDVVSSFAGTSLGREASKAQLWKVDLSYEESQNLLVETTAAIELINYAGAEMDLAGVDVLLVKSAIDRVSRGFIVDGPEATAVASLIQFADSLQITVQTAVKEDFDWYNRFMPLTQVIMDAIISRPLVKLVHQVVEDDGSIKDTASSELKNSREQVQAIERKLHQLMDNLIRNDNSYASSSEICTVNGRWCIKSMGDQFASYDGLLLSSGSDVGSLVEPVTAVPLNDELQQARILVAKAEEDVLSKLTDKILAELDHIQYLMHAIIRLDVVAARAKYSIAYGGTMPDLSLPGVVDGEVTNKGSPMNQSFIKTSTHLSRRKWKLYMLKAYHPLLLQQHRENLHNARKDFAKETADIRRKKLQGRNTITEDDLDSHLAPMKLRASQLEKDLPVPVDFVVSEKTGVLVITGPNTGGKTISLKTVGLASLMAQTGVYVLASEPVEIPWFDAIYADIGDEQSLTQSLSTFSGHMKQISAIRVQSTNKSLVLLDEVGAGTNPLEGAALGMSILESFAETGSFLTIATTHHGELKTLKYSNNLFENASVEFDEESLKPTYKILWGIPGRSNAINIAERLGLPQSILDSARKLHGTSSAEINGIIVDMESSKQDFQQHLQEAQHYLMLSRKLHEDLLTAKQKIAEHCVIQRNRKVKAISESAALARSILRNKLQQFRESAMAKKASQNWTGDNDGYTNRNLNQSPSAEVSLEKNGPSDASKPAQEKRIIIPEVGETVTVPSLGKQARVLKVEASKEEIIVQASNLKLRLRLTEIVTERVRTN